MARTFRRTMIRHPRAAPLVLTRQLASSQVLAPTEIVLRTLRNAGLSPEEAVHADAEGRRAELEASGLPMISEAAPYLAVCDHEAEFEFGMRVLLEALDTELAWTEP